MSRDRDNATPKRPLFNSNITDERLPLAAQEMIYLESFTSRLALAATNAATTFGYPQFSTACMTAVFWLQGRETKRETPPRKKRNMRKLHSKTQTKVPAHKVAAQESHYSLSCASTFALAAISTAATSSCPFRPVCMRAVFWLRAKATM